MVQRLKKIAAFIAALVKKYWLVISGAGIYHVASWIYDNPLWMAAEIHWKENGVIGMMIGAFIINTIMLFIFMNKKSDFILWNALDSLSERESEYHEAYAKWSYRKSPLKIYVVIATYIPVKLVIFILWCIKKSPKLGDLAGFAILSIIEDPFITTMYLRHGYKNGLRKRDMAIYLGSSILSIGYWALRNTVIVELVFRPLLKMF